MNYQREETLKVELGDKVVFGMFLESFAGEHAIAIRCDVASVRRGEKRAVAQ